MKPKRSLLETFYLLVIRYARWKQNPKNFTALYYIEMQNKSINIL